MMDYKMYIGINNGEEGFVLPVLPEKFELKESGDNKSYDIVNLGEVNTVNKPKLSEISIESYFPKIPGPYVSSDKLFDPSFYVNKIREWRDKKQKIRFIFIGGSLEINDLFTIEDFKINENGGEVGDIYYSMELKRYRSFIAKKVVIVKTAPTSPPAANSNPTPRPVETPPAKTHTVKKGDTLWYIAKKYLGNGNRYKEIYNLNRDKIKNPNLIYPGQVLKLP